jgi:hypothetical protein
VSVARLDSGSGIKDLEVVVWWFVFDRVSGGIVVGLWRTSTGLEVVCVGRRTGESERVTGGCEIDGRATGPELVPGGFALGGVLEDLGGEFGNTMVATDAPEVEAAMSVRSANMSAARARPMQ